MPAEYDDHQERPPPYNDVLVQEQGVDMTGGYTSPVADQDVTGYRSTAVAVVPGSGDVTVRVTWYFSDGASAVTTYEEKATTGGVPETLLFVNQGDTIASVLLTGGGGSSDYSIVESNQLPLPASADTLNQWPFWYECLHPQHLGDAAGLMNPAVAYWFNSGWASVIDATYYRGFYIDSGNVAGKEIIFVLRLGPQGSIWNVQPVVEMGAAQGKLELSWGQSVYGEDAPGPGSPDDAGIIYPPNALPHPADLTVNTVTFYTPTQYQWDLNQGASQKITSKLGTLSQMRIMGAPGDVLSTNGVNTFGRGYVACDMNGGPGIWYLKLRNILGASGQNRVHMSSLLVARQTVFDYSTV